MYLVRHNIDMEAVSSCDASNPVTQKIKHFEIAFESTSELP